MKAKNKKIQGALVMGVVFLAGVFAILCIDIMRNGVSLWSGGNTYDPKEEFILFLVNILSVILLARVYKLYWGIKTNYLLVKGMTIVLTSIVIIKEFIHMFGFSLGFLDYFLRFVSRNASLLMIICGLLFMAISKIHTKSHNKQGC